MPRGGLVRIEIRPAFDEAVMKSALQVRKASVQMLALLQSLTLKQLWNHPGLNYEKLHGMIEPVTGEQLYSLRMTGSTHAITCMLKGPTIVLISLHVQYDKAYRK